jgi:exopolyphosphatase / guanosine-5'-triphosphate,3'-diphosphate pyrophosphatase
MKKSRSVAVLDVGCFSAHLVVVRSGPDALHRPLLTHKVRLRLDQALDADGRIRDCGINHIADAVVQVKRRLDEVSVSTFLPYATSCVRDAANVDEVIAGVAQRTGITLHLLPGEQEARLSYLAARRWLGSDRPLAVLDVGGGTIELAVGHRAKPLFARSLPLGARTLTRSGLTNRDWLPAISTDLVRRITAAIPHDVLVGVAESDAVGCSKVFQGLATLTGARRTRTGARRLHLDEVKAWIPRLAELSPRRRAKLPGISAHRARQSLAGAVVAHALMTATNHDVVDVCPWSSKEGLLLDLLT